MLTLVQLIQPPLPEITKGMLTPKPQAPMVPGPGWEILADEDPVKLQAKLEAAKSFAKAEKQRLKAEEEELACQEQERKCIEAEREEARKDAERICCETEEQ